MENFKEVKVFQVNMECDKCKKGSMKVTGETILTYPPQYEHKCDCCGNIVCYPICYPRIVYKDKE